MINVLLCGGSGTRLWPVSRKDYPKQFCNIIGDTSLFQQTFTRNTQNCSKAVVVTNAANYFMAVNQLSELSAASDVTYVLEPVGRNTAPAIAIACLCADPEEVVLVTPTDHLIKLQDRYNAEIAIACAEAEKGSIVTFGITPQYPETGYGYIEADRSGGGKTYKVLQFHEKPDHKRAVEYLEKGGFYWNSGMFCFKAGVFLDELKKFTPDIYEKSVEAYKKASTDNGVVRISLDDMKAIPDMSIDYAVMEKSSLVKVIPSAFGWNDIGSFDALDQEMEKDESGNTANDKFVAVGSSNNFVISDRVVTALDVNDLIIVDTPDALLVASKGSSQKVKDIVDKINLVSKKHKNLENLTKSHVTDYRPWGQYTVLEEYESFKIKRIVVKPGKRLSLQKHFHRSEHWVVVKGSAIVTKGADEIFLKANESVYIPMGEVHRIHNPGLVDLVFLEVQVGEYLSEDDIVRIEDDYNR
jgi:mannose-1-phosphate guanylyltransferase